MVARCVPAVFVQHQLDVAPNPSPVAVVLALAETPVPLPAACRARRGFCRLSFPVDAMVYGTLLDRSALTTFVQKYPALAPAQRDGGNECVLTCVTDSGLQIAFVLGGGVSDLYALADEGAEPCCTVTITSGSPNGPKLSVDLAQFMQVVYVPPRGIHLKQRSLLSGQQLLPCSGVVSSSSMGELRAIASMRILAGVSGIAVGPVRYSTGKAPAVLDMWVNGDPNDAVLVKVWGHDGVASGFLRIFDRNTAVPVQLSGATVSETKCEYDSWYVGVVGGDCCLAGRLWPA